ncbi:alpha/beta fold hydrolase [Maricaulis sp. CAU 1757]
MLMTIVIVVLVLAVLVTLASLGAAVFSARVARKVEATAPPAGEFCEVEGGHIHFVEKGEGPPLVMIHGLGGNLHNFTYALVDRLAADHRVIAIDRPGCGYSRRAEDRLARIPEQARMIAEFLDKQGIAKALIVGHSLGGAIALSLALHHPEKTAGLALISPLVSLPGEPAGAFKGLVVASSGVRRFIARTLAVPLSIRNSEKTLSVIFGPDPTPDDFALRGGGVLTLRPEAFYAASTDLMAVAEDLPDQEKRYGDITCPVGMLYGKEDRILHAETQIKALKAALPDIVLETLEGRGHMPPVVTPDETEAFIRRMAAMATGET